RLSAAGISALDGVIRGGYYEVDGGADAVTNLADGRRRRTIGNGSGIGREIDDLSFCGGCQLTATKKRVESVHQCSQVGGVGVRTRHVREQINNNGAVVVIIAHEAVGIV